MSEPISSTPDNPIPAATPAPWDPFQLMDRMDEEALRRELDGVASTDLVYVIREGGQEVTGLSKTGVDACCMALVSQGQVIREEDLSYDVIGEDEDREALFKVETKLVYVDEGKLGLLTEELLITFSPDGRSFAGENKNGQMANYFSRLKQD